MMPQFYYESTLCLPKSTDFLMSFKNAILWFSQKLCNIKEFRKARKRALDLILKVTLSQLFLVYFLSNTIFQSLAPLPHLKRTQ